MMILRKIELGIILFGLGDSLANSYSNGLNQLSSSALNNIVVHSQATVHFSNALLWGGSPSGIQATLNSPAIPAIRSDFSGYLGGPNLHYNQPIGDIANLYDFNFNIFGITSALVNPYAAVTTHLGNTQTNFNPP